MHLQCRSSLGVQFENPPLNILLELFIQTGECRKTPVKNICLASCAPNSTAIRWLNRLMESGFVSKTDDREDARRSLVDLTPRGRDAVVRYLSAF